MFYEHSFLLEVALNGLRSVYYLTLKNSILLLEFYFLKYTLECFFELCTSNV